MKDYLERAITRLKTSLSDIRPQSQEQQEYVNPIKYIWQTIQGQTPLMERLQSYQAGLSNPTPNELKLYSALSLPETIADYVISPKQRGGFKEAFERGGDIPGALYSRGMDYDTAMNLGLFMAMVLPGTGEFTQTLKSMSGVGDVGDINKIATAKIPNEPSGRTMFDNPQPVGETWVYHTTSSKNAQKIAKEGFNRGTVIKGGFVNDNSPNPEFIQGYLKGQNPQFGAGEGVAVKVKNATNVWNNFDGGSQVLFRPQDILEIKPVKSFDDFTKNVAQRP